MSKLLDEVPYHLPTGYNHSLVSMGKLTSKELEHGEGFAPWLTQTYILSLNLLLQHWGTMARDWEWDCNEHSSIHGFLSAKLAHKGYKSHTFLFECLSIVFAHIQNVDAWACSSLIRILALPILRMPTHFFSHHPFSILERNPLHLNAYHSLAATWTSQWHLGLTTPVTQSLLGPSQLPYAIHHPPWPKTLTP